MGKPGWESRVGKHECRKQEIETKEKEIAHISVCMYISATVPLGTSGMSLGSLGLPCAILECSLRGPQGVGPGFLHVFILLCFMFLWHTFKGTLSEDFPDLGSMLAAI